MHGGRVAGRSGAVRRARRVVVAVEVGVGLIAVVGKAFVGEDTCGARERAMESDGRGRGFSGIVGVLCRESALR